MAVTVAELAAKLSLDAADMRRGLVQITAALDSFIGTLDQVGETADKNMEKVREATKSTAESTKQHTDEMAKHFETLGIRHDRALEAELRKVTESYLAITKSTTTSASDRTRAEEAFLASTRRIFRESMTESQRAAADMPKGLAAITQGFSGAANGAGVMGTAIRALSSPIGIATTGLIGIGIAMHQVQRALDEGLKQFVATGREVRMLQSVMGGTPGQVSNIADTFKLLGKDTGDLQRIMFRLSQEFETGGAGLRRLGISIRDNNGYLKSEYDLLLEARRAMSELSTQTERNAIGNDVFGRSYRMLASVFGMSEEKMRAVMVQADRMSSWTKEQQEQANRYIRAQNAVTVAWEGFMNVLGGWVVEGGIKVLEWYASWIEKMKEAAQWLERTAKSARDNFTQMGEAINRAGGLGAIQRGSAQPIVQPTDPARAAAEAAELARERERGLAMQGRRGGPEPLSSGEVAIEMAKLQRALQAAQQNLAVAESERQKRLAALAITERQAVTEGIQAVESFARTVEENFAARLSLVRNLERTGEGPLTEQTRADLESARRSIEQQRLGLQTRGAVIDVAEIDRRRDTEMKLTQALMAQNDAVMALNETDAKRAEVTLQWNEFNRAIEESNRLLKIQEGLEMDLLRLTMELEKQRARTTGEPEADIEARFAMGTLALRRRFEQRRAEFEETTGGRRRGMLERMQATDPMILQQLEEADRAAAGNLRPTPEQVRALQRGAGEETARKVRETGEIVAAFDVEMRKLDVTAEEFGFGKVMFDSFDPLPGRLAATRQALIDLRVRGLDQSGEALDRTNREIERLRANLEELQTIQTLRTIVGDVFGSITRGLNSMVQGVIQGTQTIEEAFGNMAQNIVLSLTEGIIQRGIQELQKALNEFIDYLVRSGLIKQAVLGLAGIFTGAGFSGFGGPAPDQLSGPGSGYTPPDLGTGPELLAGAQHGGVILPRPGGTRVRAGEAGEAEAIVPLDRYVIAPREKVMNVAPQREWDRPEGSAVQVIINNQGADVQHQKTSQVDGRTIIELAVRDSVTAGFNKGDYDSMMQRRYGVGRTSARRS